MLPVRLTYRIQNPSRLTQLGAGTPVLLSGTVLITEPDAAHQRLHDLVAAGQALPVDLANQILYYGGTGPSAPRQVVGAASPTSTSHLDPYAPELLALGLNGYDWQGLSETNYQTNLRSVPSHLFQRHR